MADLRLGTAEPTALRLGSVPVSVAYYGTVPVWPLIGAINGFIAATATPAGALFVGSIGGVPVTGVLTVTAGDATSSILASIDAAVFGTISATAGDATAVILGSPAAVPGIIAATAGDATGIIIGDVSIQNFISATAGDATGSLVGDIFYLATLAGVAGDATGAFVGDIFYLATITGVASNATAVINGAITIVVSTAPTLISALPNDTQVTLTWTEPSANGGAQVTSYVIEKSPNGSTGWTTAATLPVVLNDDFNGTLINPQIWTTYDRISDQVNNELNCLKSANVSVSSSTVKIVSKFESSSCGDQAPYSNPPDTNYAAVRAMSYTSGQIAQAAAPFLYGTVDVRAKIPGGIGLWPCIWMLGFEWQASQPYTANVFVGTPPALAPWPTDGWCEVDIAEFMNGARSSVNSQIHYNGNHPGGIVPLPYDATTRFMVYRLQWSAGSMVFSVDPEDGAGFRVLQNITTAGYVPNVPMYLIIHTAIGGFAGGTPDSATFPQTMEVDYARITQ